MYFGNDVSPDFYAWRFPKYDHVGVGSGSGASFSLKYQPNSVSIKGFYKF